MKRSTLLLGKKELGPEKEGRIKKKRGKDARKGKGNTTTMRGGRRKMENTFDFRHKKEKKSEGEKNDLREGGKREGKTKIIANGSGKKKALAQREDCTNLLCLLRKGGV